MRRFRCISCKYEFEVEDKETPYKCPKCYSRFIELLSGPVLKGKSWSSKSFSVRP